MAQKKLPPGVQITSMPKGAHISSPGKPKPAVKLTPKPEPKPPVHFDLGFLTYEDVSGFGFDMCSVTVGDVTVSIFRACSFGMNGSVPIEIIPQVGGKVCLSREECDAYKEEIKAKAFKAQIVTPGHPDFKKPPILH